jgi:hypothetical protein
VGGRPGLVVVVVGLSAAGFEADLAAGGTGVSVFCGWPGVATITVSGVPPGAVSASFTLVTLVFHEATPAAMADSRPAARLWIVVEGHRRRLGSGLLGGGGGGCGACRGEGVRGRGGACFDPGGRGATSGRARCPRAACLHRPPLSRATSTSTTSSRSTMFTFSVSLVPHPAADSVVASTSRAHSCPSPQWTRTRKSTVGMEPERKAAGSARSRRAADERIHPSTENNPRGDLAG